MKTQSKQQNTNWSSFVGNIETSYRFVVAKQMFNQDKVTLIMEGNLGVSLLTHILPLPWQSMRKKLSNFRFLPCNGKKRVKLFALFWLVCSFLSDWFLFCLIRSYGGNGGIVWISGWSPLKAVAVTMASKSCRGPTNLWAIEGKKLWAEEYNSAFKTEKKQRWDC